jgi:rubredoxin
MNLKRCGTCGMVTNEACGNPVCDVAPETLEVPGFAKLEQRSEYMTMLDKITNHADPILERRKEVLSSVKEESKGTKYDSGKPPLSIIPREALEGCANAFGFGAKKYGRNNFKSGIEMNRLLDAVMRHLVAYASGESKDSESDLSHLDHALAALSMAKYMEINRPDLDDRYKDNKKGEK